MIFSGNVPDVEASNLEQENDDNIRIKALYVGIDKLKPVEKAIILLYLEEKTYDEIAEIIGISKKNVSV